MARPSTTLRHGRGPNNCRPKPDHSGEFAARGASVDLQSYTPVITQAITNASLTWQISGNATVTFDNNGRFDDASSHLARLGVGFQF